MRGAVINIIGVNVQVEIIRKEVRHIKEKMEGKIILKNNGGPKITRHRRDNIDYCICSTNDRWLYFKHLYDQIIILLFS